MRIGLISISLLCMIAFSGCSPEEVNDEHVNQTSSTDLHNDNPIDQAFEKDFEIAGTTMEISYLAAKYLEAWENEWDHITKVYMDHLEFEQDRETFKTYIHAFEAFANAASDIVWLDYTDLSVDPAERAYGTAARGSSMLRMADLYKEQVFYMIQSFVGNDYTFIYSGNGAEIEKWRSETG